MAKRYSSETKAAVMAALLAGQSPSEVARTYNLPRGTVAAWQHRQRKAAGIATVATEEKREEIGDLLIGYLHELLKTLTAQLEVFSDPRFIRPQNAAEIAVLHGLLADKGLRLLEALSQPEPDDGEQPGMDAESGTAD